MPRKGRVKTAHFPYSIEQFLFPFLRDSKLHFFQWLIFHEMRARMKCWMVQSLFFAASSFLPSITSTIRISLKVFYSFSYFIEINCFVEWNHFNFFSIRKWIHNIISKSWKHKNIFVISFKHIQIILCYIYSFSYLENCYTGRLTSLPQEYLFKILKMMLRMQKHL